MIVNIHNVQKYYGANLVLSDINLEIREGDRAGLIGQNGAGKTTLFKLLTGELAPDRGQVAIRKATKIGCLAQIPDYQDATTVYEVMARAYADIRAAQAEMRELEARMAQPEVYEDEARLQRIMLQYDALRENFERGGGYEMEAHIERVAQGLGIPNAQYHRPFSSLSGGEKTKIGLAAILIEQPDLLLLDEPTNHLDMSAIEWLEQYLAGYEGTVVIISHDRYFLDKVVTKVIEIEDGEAFTYHANYSGFQQEKEERLLREFSAYQEQQKKIKKMKETIKQLIEWGMRNPQNPKFHRRANSMQKALDRMEKLKRPVLERKAMDLKLEQGDRSGKQVVVLEAIAKRFGDRTLFRDVSELLIYGERVFLIGDNGAGKSTLFKMLRGELQPDAGDVRVGARVEVGYLAQEEAPKDETKTVIQYFREHVLIDEGAARKQLSRFLFYGGDVFKAVQNLSGGEWSRLRLALLMYQKPNLLLLDEPTNHLDILSREALEEALEDYPGTLLVISHDRYFINRLAERIWSLEGGGLTNYLGNYDFYKEKRPERGVAEEAAAALQAVEEQTTASHTASAPAAQAVEAAASADVLATPDFSASAAPAAKSQPAPAKKVNLYQKAKTEEQMAALETRLQQIDTAISDPANSTDAGKLAALATEREQVQAELDAVFEKWMEFEE